MRVWVVAAVICSSLLAIGTTVVVLLGSNSDSVAEGPYANLWIMPYPGSRNLAVAPPYGITGNLLFCPHPELLTGPISCFQLADSTISDVLGSEMWPAPTPSRGCAATGWVLKVNFLNRTHLTYGPCTHPSSIVQLHDWLLLHLNFP